MGKALPHQRKIQFRLNTKNPDSDDSRVWNAFNEFRKQAQMTGMDSTDKGILTVLILHVAQLPLPEPKNQGDIELYQKLKSVIEANTKAILAKLQTTNFSRYVDDSGQTAQQALDDAVLRLVDNIETESFDISDMEDD